MMERRILSKKDFVHQANVTSGVSGEPEMSVVSQYEVPSLHLVILDNEFPFDIKFSAVERFSSVAPDASGNYIITLNKDPLYDSSKDIKTQFVIKDGSGNKYTPASFDPATKQLTLAETGTDTLADVSVWYYAPNGLMSLSLLISSGGHTVEVNLHEDSILTFNKRNAFSAKTAVYLEPYPAVEYMKLMIKVKTDYEIDMSSDLAVISIPVYIGYLSEANANPDDFVRYYIQGLYREFPPSSFLRG